MYGDLGLRLIRDSKRTTSLPILPPPQSTLIRQIIQEINILDASSSNVLQSLPSLSSIQQDFPSEACAILIHHLCMRRNRRCLLAYQRLRADKIDEMVWNGNEIKGVLSPEEEEYVRGYGLLVAGLKGRWTDVELGGSLEPPRDLYVEVRVLKDAGEIQTEYGYVRCILSLIIRVITLTKNSQLYVRQADVERLIQQGYLQRID
jgi:GINS complex subunit 1